MALSQDTWIVDLEDYISDHIEDTLLEKSKTVTVLINTELPRPLPNTVITIDLVGDVQNHVGSMDVYSTTQQAMRHELQYYLTVNTEKAYERAIIGSLLSTFTFGSAVSELLMDIDGEELRFSNLGNMDSGPSGDKTIYQSAFMLTLTVIIPYTSQLIP
jgi:hypothetical protein